MLAALLITAAHAGSVESRLSAIQESWEQTRGYCGTFLMAIYGEENAGMSTGTTCWRDTGHLRTETDTALGPVIEIQSERETWYTDPTRAAVLHMVADEALELPERRLGRSMADLVALLAKPGVRALPDTQIAGRPTWAFQVYNGEESAVILVDAGYQLPVALELRDGSDRPVMSYGLVELEVNPYFPPSAFEIQVPEGYSLVELGFDAAQEAP